MVTIARTALIVLISAVLAVFTAAAPAPADVTIKPTKGQRTHYTIFPWQELNLAFGYTYWARRGRQFRAVDNTIEPVRHVIRKRGMSLPVSYNQYMDGSTGSGTYVVTATFRYATYYVRRKYYETKRVWHTAPRSCVLSLWDGYDGEWVTARSFIYNGETQPSAGFPATDDLAYYCLDTDGSELNLSEYDETGEYVASPYFLDGESMWPAVTPALGAPEGAWVARPPGGVACQDGTWSAWDWYYCLEDYTRTPLTITADYHYWTRERVVAGKRWVFRNWQRQKVRQTYHITVKW